MQILQQQPTLEETHIASTTDLHPIRSNILMVRVLMIMLNLFFFKHDLPSCWHMFEQLIQSRHKGLIGVN
jgi:hypothetical protein